MDQLVLALVACGLLLAIGGVLAYLLTQGDKPAAAATNVEDPGEQEAAGGRRRGGSSRMQRGRRRRDAAAAGPVVADADEEGGDYEDGDEVELKGAEARKAAAKEERRQARQEAREEERAAREAKEGKRNLYEERRREKEAAREEQERLQQEEIERAAAEKQKAEDEEAAKWMGMITMETEGDEEKELQVESQGLLQQFVDYIQSRKTVVLEELAAEFGLRTQDVINRVQGLEQMGRLTGVMDDRGKFIYISEGEMQAVADFIKQRGRVSISELAAKSNALIDLSPKEVEGGAAPAIDFDLDVDEEPPAAEA